MKLNKTQLKIFEYLAYIISFGLFIFLFGKTLEFGRTFDDFMLVDKFTKSPGDAKLISSFFYAKFHFYPIYFLTHELDNFLTFLFNFNGIEITNAKIAKFTNIFLHVTNSFFVYLLLKKILKIDNDFKLNILVYISSLIFLFHPIASQVIFNITTRNESLALFFGLLTFIYSLNYFENEKKINFLFISLLFFFSLCSKLMAVFFVGLIPLTIFLVNFHKLELRKNLNKNIKIFLLLILIFLIYYYLRSIFTVSNKIYFINDLNDFIFHFFTSFKFYLIGLFFPYEHIYVYADNYDLKLSIFLSIIFLIFTIYSIFIFLKKKDPYLLIGILWVYASLSLPVLFGLIEKGFPLISNLAERYQYSSIVGFVIILTWLMKKFNDNFQKILFIRGSLIIILLLFIFILNDRSKVYVSNPVFMSQIDENSPRNVHRYAFSTEMTNAIFADDAKKYKFNLYQFYQVDPSFELAIMEFLKFYTFEENDKGIDFFEKELDKYYQDNPPTRFRLAIFYNTNKKYTKAETEILNIFKKYDEIKKEMNSENKMVTFLDPSIDDLHFELGKIYFNLERYEEALDNFKAANIVNPLHATALFNAALTLKKLNLPDDAAKLFEEAININPFLRETAKNILAEAEYNEKQN